MVQEKKVRQTVKWQGTDALGDDLLHCRVRGKGERERTESEVVAVVEGGGDYVQIGPAGVVYEAAIMHVRLTLIPTTTGILFDSGISLAELTRDAVWLRGGCRGSQSMDLRGPISFIPEQHICSVHMCLYGSVCLSQASVLSKGLSWSSWIILYTVLNGNSGISQNKYDGPLYCRAEKYVGRTPCRCPLLSHGQYADGTDGQTRQTDG